MTRKKSEHLTPGGNAFACGLPTPQLEGLPDFLQSFMRLGMPLEGEWLELCGHRMSAWFELPENLCACKTMEELNAAQIKYLTTMHRHYADYLDGVMHDTSMAQDTFEEESEDDTSKRDTSEQIVPGLDREAA